MIYLFLDIEAMEVPLAQAAEELDPHVLFDVLDETIEPETFVNVLARFTGIRASTLVGSALESRAFYSRS